MSLRSKSLVQLRSIAQGYGIEDIFSKDANRLLQDIETRQRALQPDFGVEVAPREYDARLMKRPPSKKGEGAEIEEVLAEHIARGLHLDFPEPEIWHMKYDKKEDTGTMRMPLRVIIACADRIMR